MYQTLGSFRTIKLRIFDTNLRTFWAMRFFEMLNCTLVEEQLLRAKRCQEAESLLPTTKSMKAQNFAKRATEEAQEQKPGGERPS